ncbi:GNAT family N-acetyltransferase [Shouchella hunanensis]|uniref:GNAT family N-acetyltransferase n=1 Tax=Shouchella hunanensis TaxID=766894 RepID=A0ABY7W1X6_9BACI|nr:GNAT family N-acetyltransferase [Shouchella hunanensis]WDF02688.1 GNAT family N-acetyltransferase [Shouchella hunanensis]
MKIVDYEKKFAEATAIMWNESRENFGGGDKVESAEDRDKDERNSGNLSTMLALQENKVVGYCGLAEFKTDKDALYIPLLNAHPQHIGKGIGKQLVLEAIKRTYKAGWPRLDLHTWPGNTKAVPLYKRCGFFWEEREETTHLMNFIPLVLQHPFIKRSVTETNWYQALKRDLTVKPDVEKENEFSVFTYRFEFEHDEVSVGIEHSSRKVYKIETAEAMVEYLLPHKQLFPNHPYEATLKIHNKKNCLLSIHVTETVDNRLQMKMAVDDVLEKNEQKTYRFPFIISEVRKEDEAISDGVTYPMARMPLFMDGIACPLACGYSIKKPFALQAKPQLEQGKVFFQLKNHLPTSQQVNMRVNDHPLVQWNQSEADVSLAATGVESFTLTCKQKRAGVVPLFVELASESKDRHQSLSYTEQVPFLVESDDTVGFFEKERSLVVVNGRRQLVFDYETYFVTMKQFGQDEPWTMLYPSFNEPVSNELAQTGWTLLKPEVTDNGVLITINYPIHNGDAQLTIVYEWEKNGIIEASYVLKNKSRNVLDLKQLIIPFYFQPDSIYLPIKGEVVHVSQINQVWIQDLPLDKLSDPWVFMKWASSTLGVEGKDGAECLEIDDDLCVRWKLDPLQVGEESTSKKLLLYSNIDNSIDHFMARKHTKPVVKPLKQVAFATHGFYHRGGEVNVALQTNPNQPDHGMITIVDDKSVTYPYEPMKGTETIQHKLNQPDQPVTTLAVTVQGKSIRSTHYLQALFVGNKTVTTQVEQENGVEVHLVDNGVFTFKAANSFYPSLYSIKTKREWLHHSFPTAGAKSWWNPWGGGFMTIPTNLQLRTVYEQKRQTSFVTRVDNWNQEWTGIRISITFSDHPIWKNATISQYFLTLPGCMLLTHYTELEDRQDRIDEQEWLMGCFFNRDQLFLYPTNSNQLSFRLGERTQTFAGNQLEKIARLYCEETEETLLIARPKHQRKPEFYENNDVFSYMTREPINWQQENGFAVSQPHCFVWTKGLVQAEGWEWLTSLQFKEE